MKFILPFLMFLSCVSIGIEIPLSYRNKHGFGNRRKRDSGSNNISTSLLVTESNTSRPDSLLEKERTDAIPSTKNAIQSKVLQLLPNTSDSQIDSPQNVSNRAIPLIELLKSNSKAASTLLKYGISVPDNVLTCNNVSVINVNITVLAPCCNSSDLPVVYDYTKLPVDSDTTVSLETSSDSVSTSSAPDTFTESSTVTISPPVDSNAITLETSSDSVSTLSAPDNVTGESTATTILPVDYTTTISVETSSDSVSSSSVPDNVTGESTAPTTPPVGSDNISTISVETSSDSVVTSSVPDNVTGESTDTTILPTSSDNTSTISLETSSDSVSSSSVPDTSVPDNVTGESTATTLLPVDSATTVSLETSSDSVTSPTIPDGVTGESTDTMIPSMGSDSTSTMNLETSSDLVSDTTVSDNVTGESTVTMISPVGSDSTSIIGLETSSDSVFSSLVPDNVTGEIAATTNGIDVTVSDITTVADVGSCTPLDTTEDVPNLTTVNDTSTMETIYSESTTSISSNINTIQNEVTGESVTTSLPYFTACITIHCPLMAQNRANNSVDNDSHKAQNSAKVKASYLNKNISGTNQNNKNRILAETNMRDKPNRLNYTRAHLPHSGYKTTLDSLLVSDSVTLVHTSPDAVHDLEQVRDLSTDKIPSEELYKPKNKIVKNIRKTVKPVKNIKKKLHRKRRGNRYPTKL